MKIEISQVIIQIIGFLVMLWVLKRYCWAPLLGILEERRKKIEAEFSSITSQHAELEKLMAEYTEKIRDIDSEARRRIQAAVSEGRQIAEKIQSDSQNKAKEIVDKTREELQREVYQAKTQLKNDMVDIVIEVSKRILQERLSDAKHRELIADFVEKAEFR